MTETMSRLSGRAAEKIWIQSYPAAVPAEIAPHAHASLGALFEASCAKFADRLAFSSMGRGMTFRELEQQSRKVGAWLQAKGLAKGDRVAVMTPNILQNPVTVYGILRAGMTVVNVNPLYTPRELEHQLKDSGAKAIVVLENFAHTVEQVVARTDVKHVIVCTMGDMLGLKGHIVNLVVRKVKKLVPAWSIPGHKGFKAMLAEGDKLPLKPVEVVSSDVAFLQYTGGTTGVSKGATLTHANLLANKQQIALWLEAAFAGQGRPDVLNFVCALPLYHIFALTVNSLMGIALGGHNLLIANPRDIPAFIKELQSFKAHVFPGLNTLFNAMMNNPDFKKIDFSSLMLVLGGGMAIQRPVAERWLEMTGRPITEGYGLSETSPVATVNRLDVRDFTGMIGLPLPSTDIEIRDEDGNTLPIGEVGEICIRGPQVMAGALQISFLLPLGRHGPDGRPRLREDRRPQEGHDPGLRLQCLSERDRGSGRHACGRSRMCRRRRSGRTFGRGREALRRQEGREPHHRRAEGALRRQPHQLQASPLHRVSHRTAENQCRQDPAARVARRKINRFKFGEVSASPSS